MADNSHKQLKRATFIYWLMLIYIVAALVWWFISLQKQNRLLSDFKLRQLNATIDSIAVPQLYHKELHRHHEILLLVLDFKLPPYRAIHKSSGNENEREEE